MSDQDYFVRRAQEELAAADRATCPEASRAHRDLADSYLRRIENGPSALAPPAPAPKGRVQV